MLPFRTIEGSRISFRLTRELLNRPENQKNEGYYECDDGRQVKPTQSRSVAVGTSYFPQAHYSSAVMTMHSHIDTYSLAAKKLPPNAYLQRQTMTA